MRKIENCHLQPSYCRYLDESFIEMFLKKFSISHIFLADLGHMTKMAATPIYGKNPLKIFFPRASGPIAMKLGMYDLRMQAYHRLFKL